MAAYENRYYKRENNLIHIVLHHQYSLIGWAIACIENKTIKKAKLIHVDAPGHYDAEDYYGPSANSTRDYLSRDETFVSRFFTEFITGRLRAENGEQSFFPLALYMELIDDDIIYVPSGDVPKVKSLTRFYQVLKQNGWEYPHLTNYKPSGDSRPINFNVCSIDDLATQVRGLRPEELILGMDLDHFVYIPELEGQPSKILIERVANDFVEKIDFTPGVITIAKSERYMEGLDGEFLLVMLVEAFNRRFADRI